MKSLGIAIDGGRFVRIDSQIFEPIKKVRLRTLKAGQHSARLDFYAFHGNKHRLKKTVKLEGLANTDESPAEINLRIDRLSHSVWEIQIRKPNQTVETLRVRTGAGAVLWFLIAALIMLLILAGIFFLPSILPMKRTPSEKAAVSTVIPVDDPAISREITPAEDEDDAQTSFSAKSGDESTQTSSDIENGRAEESDGNGDISVVESGDEGGIRIADEEGLKKGDTQPLALLPSLLVVYFPAESAEITPLAKSLLDSFAKDLPKGVIVEIGGHCADYGTERGRRLLSDARASAVASYLGNHIESSVRLQVQGYGVSVPATNNPFRQDLNRRVELKAKWDG